MKIFYDHQIFWKQNFGGISRYYINLIKHLIKLKVDVEVIAPFFRNIYLKELTNLKINGIYLKKNPLYLGWLINYINKNFSKYLFKKKKPDIIHSTYYNLDHLEQCSGKIIITVYDLIHEIRKNEKNFLPKKKILEKAKKIICISEETKKKLSTIYDIDINKIDVIYMGYEHILYDEILDLNLKNPYILYVGSREKYKNFDYFIKQFSKSKNVRNDFDICLFGGGPIQGKEKELILSSGIKLEQIKHFSGSDQILYSLYKQANLFIFPSKFEGFGIPLIEAQACGCPVLANDIKIFREICKDSVLYFDENKENDLSIKLEEILGSKEKLNLIKSRGDLNFLNYSWKKCAKDTLKIYQKI